jgi:hypothetical protein
MYAYVYDLFMHEMVAVCIRVHVVSIKTTAHTFLLLPLGLIKREIINLNVRFQVLTASSIKFRVFWDVLPCS